MMAADFAVVRGAEVVYLTGHVTPGRVGSVPEDIRPEVDLYFSMGGGLVTVHRDGSVTSTGKGYLAAAYAVNTPHLLRRYTAEVEVVSPAYGSFSRYRLTIALSDSFIRYGHVRYGRSRDRLQRKGDRIAGRLNRQIERAEARR